MRIGNWIFWQLFNIKLSIIRQNVQFFFLFEKRKGPTDAVSSILKRGVVYRHLNKQINVQINKIN